MDLLKQVQHAVAPLVGLSSDLPDVTDPEGVVEDEYCIDGRKDVGTPAEIARERASLDLSTCPGASSPARGLAR